MTMLGREPKVVKLARDLGLPIRGDCLASVRDFALLKTRQLLDGFDPKSMRELQRILANRLLVRVAVIESDEDVERISSEHSAFSRTLRQCLRLEFLSGDTEGITIEHENPRPGEMSYLAVIDARGPRRGRAYFTLWHEITHVLIMPEQLVFKAFRRSPTEDQKEKDPLEKTVDSIAALLAFYEPLFGPPLRAAEALEGHLTFAAIETAKAATTPEASFLASAIASVNITSQPAALVSLDFGYKKRERLALAIPELDLGFANPKAEAKLRAIHVVTNDAATKRGVAIRRNMRVPEQSVLRRAWNAPTDTHISALENQGDWTSSSRGALPNLELRVEAIRRGSFVYGLIVPVRTN